METTKSYTKIENDVLEALASSNLSKGELRVALAILRKLNGFHKDQDNISLSQIMGLTKLSNRAVIDALRQLQLVKICSLVSKGKSKGSSSIWKFEKDTTKWELVKRSSLVKFPSPVPVKISSRVTSEDKFTYKRKVKETIKENKVKSPKARRQPSPMVSFIVDKFEEVWGYKPVSWGKQSPRQQAQVTKVKIETFLKRKGQEIDDQTLQLIVTGIFERIQQTNWGQEITSIGSINKNLNKIIYKLSANGKI